MRFLSDRTALLSALMPVLQAVPTKDTPKEALRCVLLEARSNDDPGAEALVLRATNLEVSVEVMVTDVKVESPGTCLVPARPLAGLVGEIADPTVTIEQSGDVLEIPTASGRFEVVTSDAESFPALDFESANAAVEVPVQTLGELFERSAFACAREATRYAMNGVLVDLRDGKIHFTGTDGRRLSTVSRSLAADDKTEFQTLLPQRGLLTAIRALEGIANEEHALVGIRLDEGRISFTTACGAVLLQRITGNFPDCDAVVPRDLSSAVELNRGLLASNLRRAMVLTDDANPIVTITFEKDRAKFESRATGLGSAKTVMDVAMTGPGGSISFNPYFINEALKVVDADIVRFEFEDANTPGKFILGEEHVYVVMPVTGI